MYFHLYSVSVTLSLLIYSVTVLLAYQAFQEKMVTQGPRVVMGETDVMAWREPKVQQGQEVNRVSPELGVNQDHRGFEVLLEKLVARVLLVRCL